MTIPFLDLRAAYLEMRSEIDAAVARVLDGGWYVLGPEVEAFEAEFAAYCGAAHAVGADYAGVDLLPGPDGDVFVLEVNGIPGWQGFQQATGISVAPAIVELLEERVAAGRLPQATPFRV